MKQQYSFCVFDCDGVILNSNAIKTNAFSEVLRDAPRHKVEEFLNFHKKNGGVSRYEKFRYFHEVIMPCPEVDESVFRSVSKYASIVRDSLVKCDMIPGVIDYLEKLKALNIPCFINSGGDQHEIQDVFSLRGLDIYFEDIFGSPASKFDNMHSILKRLNLNGQGIFFGDARLDMEVANYSRLDFCFIYGNSEWKAGYSVCKSAGHSIAEDFRSVVKGYAC